MAEIVGTIAAAAQLAGLVVKALDSISQLHEQFKHMPEEYRRWDDQLSALSEAICCIQRNPVLHTLCIRRVIESICSEIDRLIRLCLTYAPLSPPAKPLRRVLSVIAASKVEPCISRGLASLEKDKTTLLLAILTRHSSYSTEAIGQGTRDMAKRNWKEMTESPSECAMMDCPPNDLALITPTAATRELMAVKMPKSASKSGPRNSFIPRRPARRRKIAEDSCFTNIRITGKGNVIGNSSGPKTDFCKTTFDNITLDSHNSMVGNQAPRVMLEHVKLESRQPSQRCNPAPAGSPAPTASSKEAKHTDSGKEIETTLAIRPRKFCKKTHGGVRKSGRKE